MSKYSKELLEQGIDTLSSLNDEILELEDSISKLEIELDFKNTVLEQQLAEIEELKEQLKDSKG
jgi:hypothetical protein